MAFAIDGSSGFISKLKNEGARSALFKVSCTLKGSNLNSTDGSTLLPFMCKGVQMPTSSVGIVTVNYFGRPVKFPGSRTFEDITLTIINDEGYSVRNRIENWMDQINQMETNKRANLAVSGKIGYVSDLTLEPLTKQGGIAGVSSYKFINCFPTSLDAVDMSWDSNDQIMEFTTTWAYDYFTHGSATNISGSGTGSTETSGVG